MDTGCCILDLRHSSLPGRPEVRGNVFRVCATTAILNQGDCHGRIFRLARFGLDGLCTGDPQRPDVSLALVELYFDNRPGDMGWLHGDWSVPSVHLAHLRPGAGLVDQRITPVHVGWGVSYKR